MKLAPMSLATALATVLSLAPPGSAVADLAFKPTPKTVQQTMDDLEAAVTGAGATVFARIDHAAGAAEAGMELGAAQVLIFGNPQIGTPLMQQDIRAGLALPLRVLVFDDDGQTTLVWHEADALFAGTEVDIASDDVQAVVDTLVRLTDAAAAPDPAPQPATAD